MPNRRTVYVVGAFTVLVGLLLTVFVASAHRADAADPVFGVDYCVGVNACAFNTGTIGFGSCIGEGACFVNTGSIGENACIGERACYASGLDGSSSIGDSSCNGHTACYAAGLGGGDATGNSSIGNYSCNGDGACYAAGLGAADATGDSSIGDYSCNGYEACYEAGLGGADAPGNSTIGNGSCNGNSACYTAMGSIGDNSCNGSEACFTGGSIGDCENNSIIVEACLLPPPCDAPAAPAIANQYLKSEGIDRKSAPGRSIISQVAAHMGNSDGDDEGDWFDGLGKCDEGYADAVIAFIEFL